jgi:hypothetical protein
MSDQALRELLGEGHAYSCEYADELSNHLPMALIALHRLGANAGRMRAFADHYMRRLVKKPPVTRLVSSADWESSLGKHTDEAELNAYFEGEIAASGPDDTLRRHLPVLMPGVAGGAFHGLIRMGYALDADDPQELAEGLTAWSMSYLELSGPAAPPLFGSPDEALAALHADSAFDGFKPHGGTIFEHIAEAASLAAFSPYRSCLPYERVTLAALARGALSIYASSLSFTALHMVTACHALRLTLPWVEDQAAALRHLWTAILAAYVSIGRPRPAEADAIDRGTQGVPDWDEIEGHATQSRDDHVIKLVYTCREEQKAYGWPVYQALAAQKAGLTAR